jgi:hypothetical protein
MAARQGRQTAGHAQLLRHVQCFKLKVEELEVSGGANAAAETLYELLSLSQPAKYT